ncbi:unnamed protein product [Psylliodes chrysocephalus]|uniref:Mitochondrial uncoupling protein 4 n=1 Tax=Psylliodes chrysocephalus TaxID=3402493 RepID=A0A9P0GKE6_9CUCU|nr:unnamed protein product [Psylliodes chrysocephala]
MWVNSFWCIYICGVIAACHTEIYTYPLDLVKTRLQIQGSLHDSIPEAPRRGMMKTAVGVVKEEGFFSLWTGISALWIRHVIYSGTRITVYNEIRGLFQKYGSEDKLALWQAIICGMACGFVAQLLSNPMDLIKVQLQMEGKRKLLGLPPRGTGFCNAFKRVYSIGGIRGLWIGWVPSCLRAILVAIGDLTTYDTAKRFFIKHFGLSDRIALHSLASFIAGLASTILSNPSDVIKSRIMNQPVDMHGKGLSYKGTWDCFKTTVKEEGFWALYKGFWPTWLRLGPWAVIYWDSYEYIRIIIGGKTF